MAELSNLASPIGRAIATDRITALAVALETLRSSGLLDEPNLFPAPAADHYARRLFWSDPDGRFVIVGMTWAPGQGTPLHDHAGLWGGEIVVRGCMAETTYELLESDGERFRFRAGTERLAPPGSVGMLNPPFEYHILRNAGDALAHTLHVYAGNLESTRCYAQTEGDWYRATTTQLRYDA